MEKVLFLGHATGFFCNNISKQKNKKLNNYKQKN